MTTRYLRVNQYIVKIDYVHGVLHNIPPDKSFLPNVIITYEGGVSVCMEFKTLAESEKAFIKISDILGAD